jgi:parvulin-like peptidyl-prolyl isomerase
MTSLRLRILGLALVASLAVSACGNTFRPAAANVQGTAITDAQLRTNIPLFEFLASLRQAPCGSAVKGESAQAACSRFSLTQLITEAIVRTYADAHHVRVPARSVTNAIIPLEQQLGGHAALVKRLAQQHLTFPDLRALAGRLLLVQAVAKDVASRTLSDAQLRAAYAQNRVQFTVIHAQHILVHNQRAAVKIAAQATASNFAALAKRYSKDPGSASKGGDLGATPAARLDPTFAQAALALRPGQISAPVHTKFGWHVIRLVSVQVLPFSQARPQVVAQLAGRAFTTWLQQRIAAGGIDVNPKYGRFDAKQGQVVPVTCTAATPPPSCAA